MSAVLERLTRVDLQVVVLPPIDRERSAARDRGRAAAIAAGRGQLLADALEAARELAVRAFARGGFSGTWAANEMGVSVTRANDRVAAAAAFEDAVIAAVAEDRLDPDTLEELRASTDVLTRLTGPPMPGALSNIGRPRPGVKRAPLIVALAVLVAFAASVLWMSVGSWSGLVALVVGIGVIAGLVREERQPLD